MKLEQIEVDCYYHVKYECEGYYSDAVIKISGVGKNYVEFYMVAGYEIERGTTWDNSCDHSLTRSKSDSDWDIFLKNIKKLDKQVIEKLYL